MKNENSTQKMTFGQSIKTCIKKYFKIKDRTGRREFWYFTLLVVILGFVYYLFLVDYLLYMASMSLLITYLLLLPQLFLVIPMITASIRRLHDVNMRGWWVLLMFIPIVGVVVMIVLLSRKPYPKKNKYGDCNTLG